MKMSEQEQERSEHKGAAETEARIRRSQLHAAVSRADRQAKSSSIACPTRPRLCASPTMLALLWLELNKKCNEWRAAEGEQCSERESGRSERVVG